jgi:hypothetical protein
MQQINAITLTHNIKDWLANSRNPRILHVFDNACNLVNEQRDVLSIVTPQIGNGPFNMGIENDVLFSEHFDVQSEIAIHAEQIVMGDLTIDTANAQLWNPRPDWEVLYAGREDITNRLAKLPMTDYKPNLPDVLLSTLTTSIVSADKNAILSAARQLAGLGQGLTPSGDDFMMGAIYAARIIHPPEVSSVLAREVAETAAPLTTSLSAAWIRSAGKGEAGVLWHELFEALVAGVEIQKKIDKIMATGETSGADALQGFLGTSMCWMGTTRNQN